MNTEFWNDLLALYVKLFLKQAKAYDIINLSTREGDFEVKRIILFVLVTVLCFALFGCADTPKVTPNEIDVVMPEEPEVVTPVEPKSEAPDEINIANYIQIIAETNKEKSESFFCLDDMDFKNSYVARKLVTADQFNFGDYSLFVRIPAFVYSLIDIPIYSYGFITSNTTNSVESFEEYKRFNEKYLIEEALPDGNFNDTEPGEPLFSVYYDLLAKSKIIYISEEADIIGRLRLTDGGAWVNEKYEKAKDISGRIWNSSYELLNSSGESIYFCEKEGIDAQDMYCGGFSEMFDLEHYSSNKNFYFSIESNKAKNEKVKTHDKYTVYTVKDGIYAEEAVLDLTLISDKACSIKDYDGRGKLLISVYGDIEDYTLVYDINTKDIALLEYNAYNVYLSPDGNYLAYTPPFYTEEGEIYDKEKGFYIKEIKTGKTIFYDYSDVITPRNNEYFFLGWGKENKLK